jgi:hypothetical protein
LNRSNKVTSEESQDFDAPDDDINFKRRIDKAHPRKERREFPEKASIWTDWKKPELKMLFKKA